MKIWAITGFSIIVAAFSSCEEKPTVGELVKDMVVQTNYDTTISFQNFTTFTMPMDTIGLVSNTTNASAIVSNYSKAVTAQVRKGMEKVGYQYVNFNQNADLAVNVYVIFDRSIYQTLNYPYYGYGYPGYYSYGGFYGYGGYGGFYNYPYISTYISQQAILVIDRLPCLRSGLWERAERVPQKTREQSRGNRHFANTKMCEVLTGRFPCETGADVQN